MHFRLIPVVCALVAHPFVPTLRAQSAPIPIENASRKPAHELVCVLPVGDDGIHYADENAPEMLPWGPAAFSVAPDGTFWVADTAGNRLLHWNSQGGLLAAIPLGDVVGAGDLTVSRSRVFVHDVAAQTPGIVEMSLDGAPISRYALADNEAITKIRALPDDALQVEYGFGARHARMDTRGVRSPGDQPTFMAWSPEVRTRAADMSKAAASRGSLQVGNRTIEVRVTHALGGLRFLGKTENGSFYVVVEEVALGRSIQVDQTVRHYSANGRLIGQARVPLADQHTSVAHGLAMGPDGSVYALLTRPDQVEIRRLRFTPRLAPILKPSSPLRLADMEEEKEAQMEVQEDASERACVSRDTIMTTAWAIRNNEKYLSSINTDGACERRGKPRSIKGAGTYKSIAYDWGGFDSIQSYNNAMHPGTGKAGDIERTGDGESCSRGLDCSGFVSRAWQRTSHYSTKGIPGISDRLSSTSQLVQGDAMNFYGHHVVLFVSFMEGGIVTLESTTQNGYDRVAYTTRTWADLSGYVPRRLKNVCK